MAPPVKRKTVPGRKKSISSEINDFFCTAGTKRIFFNRQKGPWASHQNPRHQGALMESSKLSFLWGPGPKTTFRRLPGAPRGFYAHALAVRILLVTKKSIESREIMKVVFMISISSVGIIKFRTFTLSIQAPWAPGQGHLISGEIDRCQRPTALKPTL